MSESINAAQEGRFRGQLFITVSTIALLTCLSGAGEVRADDDADHPALWIELGGQLSRLDEGQEVFSPSFLASRPSIFEPSQKFERLPLYSVDESGAVTFQPETSNWIFSASIHYGRSVSDKNVHQQTYPSTYHFPSIGAIEQPAAAKFADTNVQIDESHLIADFRAGKDVGLGLFGGHGSSVLNFGVRFAQFDTKSNALLKSDPDWHFHHKYVQAKYKSFVDGQIYHSNSAQANATRSFQGVGPVLSWNASTPFLGNPRSGELALDWGANAAVLFGRQKVRVHHQTTLRYHGAKYVSPPRKTSYHGPYDHSRIRSVTAPDVGAVAGLSFRIENAKVSAGYRADFFFGAMDGGIDARKNENVGFHGPFASVSVGIGG